MKWWEKPIRMMRLDYLDALHRMSSSDLDKLAKWKKEEWNINCEWVIGTPGIAPGLGHLTTFDTPKFERYPGLGDFDLIREYLPYARKYDIKLLAYLNMHWYSYEFAEKHSEWEQRLQDGRSYGRVHPLYGSGTTFCVNSGWRDWAFELIEEVMKTGIDGVFLDGPVVFPECCYCSSCREKFAKKYDADIPSWEDWSNQLWKKFIEFREESMVEFLKDGRYVVKKLNPDGVIFLNAGSWWPGGWRVARNIERLGEYQDFNGAEAFFHPSAEDIPLIFWSIEAKHLVAGGRPAVVFSHHALGSWHYLPLPYFEAKVSIAQIISCGANPWFAVFDYALDHRREEALAPMREILGFMSRNEEYYIGTRSESQVAILLSSQTSTFYLSELRELYLDPGTGVERDLRIEEGTGRRKIDLKTRKSICEEIYKNSLLGSMMILSRNHIPFDIILDEAIKDERLERYSVLMLPNSACLSDDQISGVRRFVERGGSVVSSFETGCYNGYGDVRSRNPLWDIFGIESSDGMMVPRVGEEYIKISHSEEVVVSIPAGCLMPRPINCLKLTPKRGVSVPCVYMNPISAYYAAPRGESDIPAIIYNRYGRGRSIFISSLMEDFYARYRIPAVSKILADCIRLVVGGHLKVEVESPETVHVEVRSQKSPNRMLIHLVNNTGDMQRPFSNIIPVHAIKIRIKGDPPRRAFKLSNKADLDLRRSEKGVEFMIDELKVYDVVVLEF